MKSFFIVIMLISVNVWGHGENKPGPHGGYIRMPGTFHTEVVPEKSAFKVYLLDLEFKNPLTKDSKVTATIKQKSKEFKLKCQAMNDHFLCKIPKGANLRSGELEIRADRHGGIGGPISYELPLKLLGDKDHANH